MCLWTTDRLLFPSNRTSSHLANLLFAYLSLFFFLIEISIAYFTLWLNAISMSYPASSRYKHRIMERQVSSTGQKIIVRRAKVRVTPKHQTQRDWWITTWPFCLFTFSSLNSDVLFLFFLSFGPCLGLSVIPWYAWHVHCTHGLIVFAHSSVVVLHPSNFPINRVFIEVSTLHRQSESRPESRRLNWPIGQGTADGSAPSEVLQDSSHIIKGKWADAAHKQCSQ